MPINYPLAAFATRETLQLAEMPPTPDLERLMLTPENSYLRCYRLGECSVIVTREGGRFHLSVAHPRRLPGWAEVAEAWYRCVPLAGRRTGCVALPPVADYVNVNPNCMQVVEIDGVREGFAAEAAPEGCR